MTDALVDYKTAYKYAEILEQNNNHSWAQSTKNYAEKTYKAFTNATWYLEPGATDKLNLLGYNIMFQEGLKFYELVEGKGRNPGLYRFLKSRVSLNQRPSKLLFPDKIATDRDLLSRDMIDEVPRTFKSPEDPKYYIEDLSKPGIRDLPSLPKKEENTSEIANLTKEEKELDAAAKSFGNLILEIVPKYEGPKPTIDNLPDKLAKADLLSKELSTAVDLRREKKQNE
jgi:hypothetical protein